MKAITTKTESKKSIARRIGTINAKQAIEGFNKNNRITGLTNGAFSLISLIDAVLEITGDANVIISTWSAGFYDVNAISELIESGKITDFKIILDRSYKTRLAQYATTVDDLFSAENIRTTNTHSKFVLIQNADWNVCIRSSMNLNENKRCENFDIDNDCWYIVKSDDNQSGDDSDELTRSSEHDWNTDWYSHSGNYGAGLAEAMVVLLNRRGFNIKASAV